jgi:hypothetical protein
MATKKNLRMTPAEMEQLTLHEFADYLANAVVLLRRMPDVPISDLLSRPADDVAGLVARLRRDQSGEKPETLPDWVERSET